jgi:hypothetical protein
VSEYALKDLDANFTEYEGERIGLIFRCPNCGVAGSVMFKGTKYQTKYPSATWDHAGDALETISLTPSVLMRDHFHSWIRNGKLCVDSPFSCKKAAS